MPRPSSYVVFCLKKKMPVDADRVTAPADGTLLDLVSDLFQSDLPHFLSTFRGPPSLFFPYHSASAHFYPLSLHDALPISTKCRGLVSLNQVIKEIICLQPLK